MVRSLQAASRAQRTPRGCSPRRPGSRPGIPAAVKTYLDLFYNLDLLGGSRVSDQAWQDSFHTAIRVSAAAARGCAIAWREDFRPDVARITVPVLIVQGAQDQVMPPGATGNRLSVLLADARLVVIPDGPHAITWTHAAEVNRALVGFLRALLQARRPPMPQPAQRTGAPAAANGRAGGRAKIADR
jgi:pimeloyl-ACP methyl ester carboxylesterase